MDRQLPKCEVCDNEEFELKEGYYYCKECGTQSQDVRDVEIDEDEFHLAAVRFTSKKIAPTKVAASKVDLTTWECFNYLLRGLVEELIELGAKDELKEVTLQLWTAYLSKIQVAFFNKKHPELPRLGIGYSPKDAAILYNHRVSAKKIRKVKPNSKNDGRMVVSNKKRRFIEAEYASLASSFTERTMSSSFLNTSQSSVTGSTTTAGAIKLEFSTKAKRRFKTVMRKSHIKKHESDSEKTLKCHSFGKIFSKATSKLEMLESIKRQILYAILYLALNLIEDDIQLCDMLRLMREGHLSSNRINHLLPENFQDRCKEVIFGKKCSSRRIVFLEHSIRENAADLCRLIHIPQLKTPNLHVIASRFVADLCLPKDVALYVKRFLNLLPPEMNFRLDQYETPCYEGRAIAYIIFVLKLIFGLDDFKENNISKSSIEINEEIEKESISHSKLFVWNEWQRYITMRRNIIAQCYLPTSSSVKINTNRTQKIRELIADYKTEDTSEKKKKTKHANFEKIFESLPCVKDNLEEVTSPKLPFSFTPNVVCFREIFNNNLRSSRNNNVFIPDYMEEDHSVKDINSLLSPKRLCRLFKKRNIKINVSKISCNSNRNLIGVFKNYDELLRRQEYKKVRIREAIFTIDEFDFIDEIAARNKIQLKMKRENDEKELNNFRLDFEMNLNKIEDSEGLISSSSDDDEPPPPPPPPTKKQKLIEKKEKTYKIKRIVLDDGSVLEPKRNLEMNDGIGVLTQNNNVDDQTDDSSDSDENSMDIDYKKSLDLNVSDFDYWILFGRMSRLTKDQFNEVKNKFPKNFLWLIETCSDISGIDVYYLYEELLIIENYFLNVLEPLGNIKNIWKVKNKPFQRNLNAIIEVYKNKW